MNTVITPVNLLVNPEFRYLDSTASAGQHYVAGWNTSGYGDIQACDMQDGFGEKTSGSCVLIRPGKSFWQFQALPDLGLDMKERTLKLGAEIKQAEPSSLRIKLSLMGIESQDGTWSPAELGFGDKRVFSRHGRGELVVLDERTASSSNKAGQEYIETEGLLIDWRFETTKESSSQYRNAAGIRVEFENTSSSPVWIRHPVLAEGKILPRGYVRGKPLPGYSKMIPRTMKKLLEGKPLHILTLGSSIDRGSANPRLYLYDENPSSPQYKKPLFENHRFDSEKTGRPDLESYIGLFQHYFMYTGRMRLELIKKFNLPVNRILLNVMAVDGSSIGEAHSGFAEYSYFEGKPDPGANGHGQADSWETLYPELFSGGKIPPPDLVVFGGGHNEQIDKPDRIAAYEGALRWFQRHFPKVEFINCMWIRDKENPDSLSNPMEKLCQHYAIPFIDMGELILALRKSSNYYAVAPDGGHPQAAAHYIWSKQLEKAFEIADAEQEWLPQKYMPERINTYSYNWEGDIITFTAPHPRFVENRMMILEDGAFNLWATHEPPASGTPAKLKILINGKEMSSESGRGGNFKQRNSRNSSFAYGRLETGKRHIVEVIGSNPYMIAADHKVALKKVFHPADSTSWNKPSKVEDFISTWGAPYGSRCFVLHEGETAEIAAEGSIFSIAYLDEEAGGTFTVSIDSGLQAKTDANIPHICSMGKKYYAENRLPVSATHFGRHKITVASTSGRVRIIGLYSYDTR